MPGTATQSLDPRVLSGYQLRLAYWARKRRLRCQLPQAPLRARLFPVDAAPKGLLLHSGGTGIGTLEWAETGPRQSQGELTDAEWLVLLATLSPEQLGALFWAHFAFSKKDECYYQTDYLDQWIPHGGGLNRYTYGIESPHFPHGRTKQYKDQTIALVEALVRERGVEWITCHKFVDKQKRDPGSIVTADWFVHLPVRLYWGNITIQQILSCEGLD